MNRFDEFMEFFFSTKTRIILTFVSAFCVVMIFSADLRHNFILGLKEFEQNIVIPFIGYFVIFLFLRHLYRSKGGGKKT